MLAISDAPLRDTTIQGLILQVPEPYDEGHELTEKEAGVMNQTYRENVRNNYSGKIKKLCEEHKVEKASQLPDEVRSSLQSKLLDYCEGYEFGVSGRTAADPEYTQAVQLAIGCVKDALKDKNIKLAEVGAEKIKEMAEQAVDDNPAFLEKARAIVAAKRAAATDIKIEL